MSASVENIDDEQLRKQLESYSGRKIGPITYTTRNLYLKKLEKYLKGEKSSIATATTNRQTQIDSHDDDDDASYYNVPRSKSPKNEFDLSNRSSKYYSYLSEDSSSSADSSFLTSPLARPSLPRSRFNKDHKEDNCVGGNDGRSTTSVNNDFQRPSTSLFGSKSNYLMKSLYENNNAAQQQCRSGYFSKYDSTSDIKNNSKISVLLLAAGFAIFVVTAYIYMQKRLNIVVFQDPKDYFIICPKKSSDPLALCVEKSDLYQMQELMSNIIMMARSSAGDHDCGYRTTDGITREELDDFIRHNSHFKLNLVLTIVVKNLHWKVQTLNSDGKLTLDIDDIAIVASSEPMLSLRCRFERTIKKFVYVIVTFSVLIATLIFANLAYKTHLKQQELNQNDENELLEKVIDVLKQHSELCERECDKFNPWLPVSYVRDMVLPLNERKLKNKLWLKVINKLKKHESKLIFKVDTVKGEDYEVMKWQTNSSTLNHHMNGGGSRGHLKTWQGPAISNSERPIQKLYPPLTNCLKVRNMFNSEVEIGEDWKRVVRDAILEKVGPGHGIVSLVVDSKSKEGCVYIRCVDEKKAGEAFDSLHCWWFDNRLVTVKYLRLQRFLERFPDGANNTKLLRPSNEAKLSLSMPYPKSLLENC